MDSVLVLNADFAPLHVVSWERAVCLILAEKVNVICEAAGKVIRSANFEMAWPSVVAVKEYVSDGGRVRYKRANVFARDRYACVYCGIRPLRRDGSPATHKLTLDHVVPRSRSFEVRRGTERRVLVKLPWSGHKVPVTGWDNVVTACKPCNHAKGDKTPEEAGFLPQRPSQPNARESLRIILQKQGLPEDWQQFVGAA